jgi:hypothetical protein
LKKIEATAKTPEAAKGEVHFKSQNARCKIRKKEDEANIAPTRGGSGKRA